MRTLKYISPSFCVLKEVISYTLGITTVSCYGTIPDHLFVGAWANNFRKLEATHSRSVRAPLRWISEEVAFVPTMVLHHRSTLQTSWGSSPHCLLYIR